MENKQNNNIPKVTITGLNLDSGEITEEVFEGFVEGITTVNVKVPSKRDLAEQAEEEARLNFNEFMESFEENK